MAVLSLDKRLVVFCSSATARFALALDVRLDLCEVEVLHCFVGSLDALGPDVMVSAVALMVVNSLVMSWYSAT